MPPDQDQTTTTTEPDLSEEAGDILESHDFSEAIVEQVRYGGYDEGVYTKHRLNVIEAENSDLAAKLREAIKEQAAREAADKARDEEVARLDAFEAEQRAEAMAALQDEAATEAHDAEIDTFLAEGGIAKARDLADALSGRETSPAEALTAWDSASEAEREVATQFGVGVIDFDPSEILGTGGAS
jgi:hypothetical protein